MQTALLRVLQGLTADRHHVQEVADFCRMHLSHVARRSGESYALHCHEVAAVLREVSDDPLILRVALLHDLPVCDDGDSLLRASPLTVSEQRLVRDMYRLRRLHIDEQTKDLDRTLDAFATDERLLILRMAHRVNDVRHIQRFSETLRKQICRETLHMYSAIAGRLGMHVWRHEMEDDCFRLLRPEAAASLQHQFDLHRKNDMKCLKHTSDLLQKELKRRGIRSDVTYRPKSLYSTYRKMVVKRRRFDALTDRLAVRIIVDGIDDCYRALGVVHARLHPIPGKLKDYIGAPKENGYRSIHTVVYPLPGVSEYPIEIQIRDTIMHRECEYGTSCHAEYKQGLYALRSRLTRVDLFRNLLILRESVRSPEQFETALRTYFHEKRIALFDTRNNLYHLPLPVSAMDFACHTAGKRCLSLKEIRVNGRPAPMDADLHDGDTVECRFGRSIRMKKDWIRLCKQPSSRRILRSLLS